MLTRITSALYQYGLAMGGKEGVRHVLRCESPSDLFELGVKLTFTFPSFN